MLSSIIILTVSFGDSEGKMASNQGVEKFIYNDATQSIDYNYWLATFESYLETSFLDYKASNESDKYAGKIFIQCCGTHMMSTLAATSGDWQNLTYTQMKEICDDRYLVQNIRMDVFRFSCMRLNPGELLVDYVARLRPLASLTNTNSDKAIIEKLIQDPSVADLLNGRLLDKLLKPQITLRAIVDWSTTEELKSTLKNQTATNTTCLNQLMVPSYSYKSNKYQSKPRTNQRRSSNSSNGSYTSDKTDKIHQLETTDDAPDPHNSINLVKYINSITSRRCPQQLIEMNGITLKATADTGAEVNVISAQTYHQMVTKPTLNKCYAKLMAYNSDKQIPTLGQFKTLMKWFNKSHIVEFIVIDCQSKQIDNLICYQTMLDFKVDFNEVFDNKLSVNTITNLNTTSDPLYFTGIKLKQYVLNKWPNRFVKTVGDVPESEFEPIHLIFDINKTPIRCPSQLIATHLLEPTKAKVDQWEHNNILVPIEYNDNITWVSSLNPVEKSHGKPENAILTADDIRLTCNFKNLNNAILTDVISVLPDQRQIKYDLTGALIFTKLDIRDAFSCLKFDEVTSNKMVFSTPWGLYKLKRLAQGINVASAIFQNFMTTKFKDIKNAKQCIDDTLIYGKPNYAEIGTTNAIKSAVYNHNEALFRVMDRMELLNLTLNPEKCQFGVDQVDFYGNEISTKGTRPLQPKIDAFKSSKDPTNKSELKSLQGMCAHFNDMLPDKANITHGLSQLAKKYTDFKWTADHSKEVQALKDSLITKYLSHYDKTLASEIFVDAGPHGIAAIFTQIDKNNKKWLISCANHTFSEIEDRFSQIEKETLAIVWTLLHYKNELICNNNFTIMSDNEAIVKLLSRHAKIKPSTPLRILSWLSKITGFTYKIQHVPGKANIADYLSRCHNEDKSIKIFNDLRSIYQINSEITALIQSIQDIESGLTLLELQNHQANDPDLISIALAIKNKSTPPPNNKYTRLFHKITSHQPTNLLILNNRIILPNDLIDKDATCSTN